MLALFACATLLLDSRLFRAFPKPKGLLLFFVLGEVFAGVALWRQQAWLAAAGFFQITGFHGAFAIDRFAIFFNWILVIAASMVAVVSYRNCETENEHHGESYGLILLAQSGMYFLATGARSDALVLLAISSAAVGFVLKLSAVSGNLWAPVAEYLSVGSKIASIAFLLRLLTGPLARARGLWEPLLVFVALAMLAFGTVAARNQTSIKRLLAGYSISDAGFMLLGIIAGNQTGIHGIVVYVAVYTFMNLGACLVLIALRRGNLIREDVGAIAALMHKSPGYAALMLIFLFSLAGIPPTAGFFGKYYILLSLVQTGHFNLAIVATLYAAVAIYYHVKVVRGMFVRDKIAHHPLALSFGL
ncbi:MAG: NADH-quinone oxidoreductase subunit N, partial [Acidobacteriia bacterium]|nr:NADH-quinone oxidoreductase subunit N [Terriglobia bacterium]MBV8904490.1 NADH-quinone oxidoreductase subunit N [Terriglobia bacterium]